MATSPLLPHVMIFPFMAQGHTLPLLDLANSLATRGLKITIVTTPSNAPFFVSKTSSHHSTISVMVIPFPNVEELPQGCENVAQLPSMDLFPTFIASTKNLKQPFQDILNDMSRHGSLPLCIISDFFLSWTAEICNCFGIPRIVFHGMGVLALAIVNLASQLVPCIAELSYKDSIQFPNVTLPFPLKKADLPDHFLRPEDQNQLFQRIVEEIGEADANSWGVLINSFEGLEGEYVPVFENSSNVQRKGRGRAWCVGPLLLHQEKEQERHLGPSNEKQSCPRIKWLDQQREPGSVIYVSFGSLWHMSDIQMDEIAFGLQMAAQPFIWVVRSKTWVAPDGWDERVKERGLVVRDWVEQRNILSHPAIGGFLSHCGWNSLLEGLSMGLPILAWPLGAEQRLNAKYLTMGLGAGIMVPQGYLVGEEETVTVHRDVIRDGVIELMRGEKGDKARERAKHLGKLARQAVKKGGSSDKKLDEFIECLTTKQKLCD